MILDLASIPIFVVNCADRPDRLESISRQLDEFGLTFQVAHGISCQPGYLGCALSHLRAISLAGLRPPFLVLEDDCRLTPQFQCRLEVPDDADAFYLGISHWGMLPDDPDQGVMHATVATCHDSRFLRVHNMLSSHAIVYVSERFHLAARQVTLQYLLNARPFDIGLASLQRDHLVLTPSTPFVYQDEEFGGAEMATRPPLSPREPSEVAQLLRS